MEDFLMARNLTSTFYAPDRITVTNPDSGRTVDCNVIDFGKDRITAAVNGVKIILNRTDKGYFEGKMAGMTLRYKL
jgi:hypothetical protein